ncbi:MAG: DNA polymerase III subunit delta [Solirubrobacterales bacterium]|nr:DNA polymerase III subunit delta [Solirubrobacterales bacterium]
MPDLKPAYLVCGDDDAKIDAWRGRVRRRAEADHGPGGLEFFDARSDDASAVAASLAALTFATGTRYLLVDDVGAWKAADVEPLLDALAAPTPETVLVLVVRGKPLKGLVKAVEGVGGEVHTYAAPKPWELPRWASGRARELGLGLDGEAAKLLVALAGPSQRRMESELEKLRIALHPETTVRAEDVERLVAGEASAKVYDLADALVGGDVQAALTLAEDLTAQGERPSRFVYPVVGRLREVHRAVAMLEAGSTEKEAASALRMPPWRAKKVLALARRVDRGPLERAVCRFADLEVELRGGGALDEGTAVTLALARS